jgi:hypothetical protein
MSDMFNLRLPASELAKLRPFHLHGPAARREGLVPETVAHAAITAAATRRRRPVHHLSGFARA